MILILARCLQPRWSTSEAKLDTAARVGRLLSQKAGSAGASEQEVGGFRIAAPSAAEAAARKGICDRRYYSYQLSHRLVIYSWAESFSCQALIDPP